MTTAQFVSDGRSMPYTPSGDVAAGDVVVRGSVVGVANRPIASGVLGAIAISGVHKFPKDNGSASALAQGTLVYWDAGAQEVTTTAGSNKKLGYVHEAATAAATTVDVNIDR